MALGMAGTKMEQPRQFYQGKGLPYSCRMTRRLRSVTGCLVAASLTLGACGSDTKPDTGYGKGQAVPPAVNCTDFCRRAADCAARLCNEDTKSTRFDAVEGLLETSCLSMCTDALLQQSFPTAAWQCLFQSSCRQVLDYDTCNSDGSYTCD
jgi:hypothetical protein